MKYSNGASEWNIMKGLVATGRIRENAVVGLRRRLGPVARVMAVLAGTALVAGACGGSDGQGADRPGATVPDGEDSAAAPSPGSAASATTTTTVIDISTKPATITVEYADAVMDALDRVLSDAIREFVAADGPTKSFDDKLNAVYDEPSLENARMEYGSAAAGGMDAFKDPPGDVTTSVVKVLKSEPNCVVLSVLRDFGATLVAPKSDARTTGYVAWQPTGADGDPQSFNRTPWSIVFDGNVLDGEEPRNAC